jgi:hypothetical protein
VQIKAADRQIHKIAERYPEISLLTEIHGVGEITALAFVLTIDDKERFEKSREVGPYLGIVPGQDIDRHFVALANKTKKHHCAAFVGFHRHAGLH